MPDRMAEKKMKWELVALAMMRARVVLPEPGGPQKMREVSWSVSISRRSSFPSPRRCSCPMNSSTVRGRIRSARGASLSCRLVLSYQKGP